MPDIAESRQEPRRYPAVEYVDGALRMTTHEAKSGEFAGWNALEQGCTVVRGNKLVWLK